VKVVAEDAPSVRAADGDGAGPRRVRKPSGGWFPDERTGGGTAEVHLDDPAALSVAAFSACKHACQATGNRCLQRVRRAKFIEKLLPWLCLKGISTGDVSEALTALLGPDAPGLSASTITRRTAGQL